MKNPLFSARLSITYLTEEDLRSVHELLSMPETDQYNALGVPENIDTTKRIINPWILNNLEPEIVNYTFSIKLKADGQFIGLIGLKIGKEKYQSGEIWYKVNKKYWGKSYATEAVNTIISFGFDTLNLHRVEAGVAVQNVASIRVLEKARMSLEGRMRQVLPLKSGWSDNFIYAILDTDERGILDV